jgi:O-Antigen ligase
MSLWQHPYNPSNRRLPSSPPFLLALLLFFFIQIEPTILGRAYTHFLGLNAAGMEGSFLGTGSLFTVVQTLSLLTIVLPVLIWATSRPLAWGSNLPSIAIRSGLGLWLTGAAISTLAHFENPLVILNFVAGIGSAAAVFYAVRRLRITNLRQVEAIFAVLYLGALIPAVQGIVGYYQVWGIPSVQTLLEAKYHPEIWQVSSPFGNPDNVATLYCVLACPCLAMVSLKMFSRRMRLLAALVLVCAGLNLLLTMARASFIVFVAALASVNIFMRNRKMWLISVGAMFFAIASPLVNSAKMRDYFGAALRVDTATDNSIAERMESIRRSWQHFLEHPVIGVGAYQSSTFLVEKNAHELPIWQAAEHGIFGLLGVLLVTAGLLGRFLKLLKGGRGRDYVTLEFIFLFGPAMYFAKGLFAEVNINNTVVNTWICSVFAMLAIADARTWAPSPAIIQALRTYTHLEANPTLVSGR